MGTDANAPFRAEQASEYEGDDWWTWAIWIEGPLEMLDQVKFVEYTLHSTFKNPVRNITERKTKFRLETAGWGGFPIYIMIRMRNGTEWRLEHELTLFYPDGRENTA